MLCSKMVHTERPAAAVCPFASRRLAGKPRYVYGNDRARDLGALSVIMLKYAGANKKHLRLYFWQCPQLHYHRPHSRRDVHL